MSEGQGVEKGPDARRRPRVAREAYFLYVERATEGADEADGPLSASWDDGVEQVHHRADALGQVALELGQLLAGRNSSSVM